MKNLLAGILFFAVASTLPLSATVYTFGNFDYDLRTSAGASWSSGNLALGKFALNFTPTALNVSDWSAKWISDSAGYFDGSGPEWSAELVLANNTTFSAGDQLYLWAYDSVVGPNCQWALLTDPSWKVVVNSPLATDPILFDFTARTTALLGSINGVDQTVRSAALVAAAPVPEPATWVSVAAGASMILLLARRRRTSSVPR